MWTLVKSRRRFHDRAPFHEIPTGTVWTGPARTNSWQATIWLLLRTDLIYAFRYPKNLPTRKEVKFMDRRLDPGERRLVNALLAGVLDGWRPSIPLEELIVRDMDDGGMGSLRIGRAGPDRHFGRELVEGWYLDEDDMPISVSINVDQFGELFEVDSWKVDFSKRISLPSRMGDVCLGPIK